MNIIGNGIPVVTSYATAIGNAVTTIHTVNAKARYAVVRMAFTNTGTVTTVTFRVNGVIVENISTNAVAAGNFGAGLQGVAVVSGNGGTFPSQRTYSVNAGQTIQVGGTTASAGTAHVTVEEYY